MRIVRISADFVPSIAMLATIDLDIAQCITSKHLPQKKPHTYFEATTKDHEIGISALKDVHNPLPSGSNLAEFPSDFREIQPLPYHRTALST